MASLLDPIGFGKELKKGYTSTLEKIKAATPQTPPPKTGTLAKIKSSVPQTPPPMTGVLDKIKASVKPVIETIKKDYGDLQPVPKPTKKESTYSLYLKERVKNEEKKAVETKLNDEKFKVEFEKRKREISKSAKPINKDYKEPGWVGQAVEGINSSTIQSVGSLFSGLEKTGYKYDNEFLKKWGAKVSDKMMKTIAANPEWAPPENMGKWKDPNFYIRNVTQILPSLGIGILGASAGTLAGGVVGGPVGAAIGGTTVGFMTTSNLEGGSAFRELQEAGVPLSKATKEADMIGKINGSLELLPIGRILNKTPAGELLQKKLTQRVVKEILKQGITEGSTEGLQEIVTNSVMKEYMENRGLFDGVLESVVFGALVGGASGSVAEVIKSPELQKGVQTLAKDTRGSSPLLFPAPEGKLNFKTTQKSKGISPGQQTLGITEPSVPIVPAKTEMMKVEKPLSPETEAHKKNTTEEFSKEIQKKMDDNDIGIDEAQQSLEVLKALDEKHPLIKELETHVKSLNAEMTKALEEVKKEVGDEIVPEGGMTNDQVAKSIGEILKKNRFAFTSRGRTLNDWIDSNMAAKDWPSFVNNFQKIYEKSLTKGQSFGSRPEVTKFVDKLKSGIMDQVEMEQVMTRLPDYLKPQKNEAPRRAEGRVQDVRPSVQEVSQPPARTESPSPAADQTGSKQAGLDLELPKEVKEGEKSRVYERLQEEYPEILGEEVTYDKMKLKEDAANAVDLVEKDKVKAYRLAMNAESSPDVTSTAVNIALSEKALKDGNYELYGQLVKNRSLAQTRRGQEIVAEKGSVTDNSTSRYVKELVKMRLEKLGTSYLSNLKPDFLKNKEKTPVRKATEIIDEEVKKVQKRVSKAKEFDLKAAQDLIDSLICK